MENLNIKDAIIIKLYPFGETSLSIYWITKELGLITTIAKGARSSPSSKKTNSFTGKLDLFISGDILISKSKKETFYLRDLNVKDYNRELCSDFNKINTYEYFCYLCIKTMEINSPSLEIYDLLTKSLDYIKNKNITKKLIYRFETKLTQILGINENSLEINNSYIYIVENYINNLPSFNKKRKNIIENLPEN